MEKHLLTRGNVLRLFFNFSNMYITRQIFSGRQILYKTILLSLIFFSAYIYQANAATKATNTPGSWNVPAIWTSAGVPASGDNVTVNHATSVNTNLTVSAGGVYTINSPTIDAPGGTAHTLTVGGALFGGYGTLEVKSAMTIEGAFAISDFGRVYVRNGAILTVGAATFAALSDIIVDEGGTLIVNGNLLVYGNAPQINGDLIINGNYTGDALSAIYGTGSMTTTGSVVTILTGTAFGTLSDCGGSCTYSSCSNTATINSSSTTVCAGTAATLTAGLSPSGFGTVTYQWQSSTTVAGGYSNITGATSSTYSAGSASTAYYRVRITRLSCTATSIPVLLTVVPIPTVTSTTPASRCGSGSITLAATPSAGIINWFAASTGGTSILAANSYSPNVTGTTTYYAAAVNGTCISASRTAVVATVNAIPTITSSTPASRCGPGSVTLSAVASAGNINWYDLSSGGSPLSSGTSFNPSITATTTYYADATSSGCTTGSRTAVTATIAPCAVVWSGGTSTDWNTPSNWNLAFVPATINAVTIPSGAPFQPAITSTAWSAGVIVSSGASLTITSTGVLNVTGNITNNGAVNTVTGSTVGFTGSSVQTITGVPALHNVVINNVNGSDVSILSALTINGTLTLAKGELKTGSNLNLNFDNGGNIGYNAADAGKISGVVTGIREGLVRTHYIAAPFSGVTTAQINVTTPLFYNNYWKMYVKDFATQGWTAVTSMTTAMPLGSAYTLAFPVTSTLVLTGTYNHSVTFTSPSYSNALAGKYILIGNPYPSTLDWTASTGWTKSNVGNAVYFWNASSNSASSYVNGLGAGNPTGTPYISAMQSFMVATTGSGGTSAVSIANGVRLTANIPYLREASDETVRIKLQAENEAEWDDAVIRFNEYATNEFDHELDAYKIINQGYMPSVYSVSAGTLYAINSVADAESMQTIQIAVKLPADGNYTLSVANSDPSIDYILVDKKLGTENLITGPAYAFSGLATDDVYRFELKLRTTAFKMGEETSSVAPLQIHSSAKGFVIQTKEYNGSVAAVEVMDVTGKILNVIPQKTLSENTYVPLDVTEGAYLIKVKVDNDVFVQVVTLTR